LKFSLSEFRVCVRAIFAFGAGYKLGERYRLGEVMRATISRLAPQRRRATAFGIMNAVYGVAWFAGSVLLGVLYDLSLVAVVLTSALLQAAALSIFVRLAARKA
jgi:MFS family permease